MSPETSDFSFIHLYTVWFFGTDLLNADYIITLKKNQGSLYENVEQLFKSAIRTRFQGIEHSEYHTREQAHGREELRYYLMLTDIGERIDPNHKWSKLKSVGMVESVRNMDGKTTVETRYYISSLSNNAKVFGQSVRSHWGVENSLHWGGVSAGEATRPQNLLC